MWLWILSDLIINKFLMISASIDAADKHHTIIRLVLWPQIGCYIKAWRWCVCCAHCTNQRSSSPDYIQRSTAIARRNKKTFAQRRKSSIIKSTINKINVLLKCTASKGCVQDHLEKYRTSRCRTGIEREWRLWRVKGIRSLQTSLGELHKTNQPLISTYLTTCGE